MASAFCLCWRFFFPTAIIIVFFFLIQCLKSHGILNIAVLLLCLVPDLGGLVVGCLSCHSVNPQLPPVIMRPVSGKCVKALCRFHL